jgi:hypothetical protein
MNSDQVERALFSLTGSVEAVRDTTISGATVHGISVQQTTQTKENLSKPNTVKSSSSNEQSATTK